MKKTGVFITFLLSACLLSGCAGRQNQMTKFNSLKVEETDSAVVSAGEVEIHKQNGAVLSVEAGKDTEGTFRIVYSKDEGDLEITQNGNCILSLKKGAVDDVDSGDITVTRAKGWNYFVLSGDDCTCEYRVVLTPSDISEILSGGAGSIDVK